ncbi:MAG: LruC domain-containing protein, partial [Algicola sp.]|nr:LruC domain-containing protein [Algicola sp.]
TAVFLFSFTNAVDSSVLASAPYNPFIFATFDRGIEVHLPNQAPTDLANIGLFGTQDDDSLPSSGRYYITADNFPWALNITSRWKHPFERVDITLAYPQIKPWAESSGSTNQSWFTSGVASKCWQCQ